MRRRGALPTFLVIGRPQCGTTSLHHYLGLHPEIQVSRIKQLDFFFETPDVGSGPTGLARETGAPAAPRSGNWARGLDWYASHFDAEVPVRGEASPGYTSPLHPGCAERIVRALGPIPLVLCVRDPVERALAHWHHAFTHGVEERKADEAILAGSHYVESSRYATLLAPYLSHWPAGSICVVDQHELATRRAATLARLFAFLGADPGFRDDRFAVELNRGGSRSGARYRALALLRRRPWWSRVADRVPLSLRGTVERATDGRQPEHALEQRTLSPERKLSLEDDLRDEVRGLRELTGQQFASWSV